MFCLNLIILSQIIFGKEILCHVIRNCKEYPSAVDMVNPYISDGLGEVKMSSNKIPITGTTTVDGSVPVAGAVNFDGEVRASGTVTIVARSRPTARPRSTSPGPLAIMLVTPHKPSKRSRSIIPIIIRTKSSPIKQGISPISIPALQPITAATPPTVPTWSFNPVSPPIPNLLQSYPQEDVTECGYIVVSGNEVPLTGTTGVDGVLATSGDITFNGYVPAKGSVVITCKSF